ncbi:MAG: hypothetical protein M3333_09020, partial [Actinomycetota bacterium]|nr:hypothetical protein [Actinomycetota bacterium]
MSPVRAFLLLLALLVLAGVVLWVTTRPDRAEPIRMERPEATGETRSTQTQAESRPNERPTKAEARKIFRELRSRAYKAIETQDLNTLHRIYTANGPHFSRVTRQVRSLIEDNVIAQSRAHLLRLRVLVRTRNSIEIRSKSRFFPCFTDATGHN